jgi:cytochrome b subunit of formate dehydrogenase
MTPSLRGFLHASIAVAALLLSSAAAPAPAGAQETTCADCHDVEVTSPVHGGLACTDCHSAANAEEVPHPDAVAEEIQGGLACATCHDAGEALDQSIHAGIAGCADCHGEAHGILPSSEVKSPTSPWGEVQTCAQCHEDDTIQRFVQSVHGRALMVSGLVSAPSCNDCHGSHGIVPVGDSESPVSWQNGPETCGTCHVFILDEWLTRSAHGTFWQQGREDAPACITCHNGHATRNPQSVEARLELPLTCSRCHADAFHTYRDSFHGKVNDLGFFDSATCSDCHTPHENLPASDPRASVHPDNLQATCATCHPGISPAFVSFDPHLDPTDPEDSRAIYYVWLFMTGLLIAVFAFFAVHATLWLQRAVVARRRGGLSAVGHAAEGPHVRRFSSVQMGVHVVVIVTFLVLAATGLPLRFHFAGWAQTVVDAFGGVRSTRFLHRFAAILTFGYFAFHIGHLIVRSLVRREKGMLWGWKSMVPRGKDFRDLWDNFRYFLYLRPRPAFDRWTYWEKFDYFAVFWGVAIIGLSGLMLWLPDFFTRFLPGWVINAASVIHGDEALLATGFIFIFHFFHTHLRPESFPLDPVIFTGSMPLARFQEERPLEYQRLVDEGRLEEKLVPPPTRARLLAAHVFGFTAVLLGLLLAYGILWGVLKY